MLKTYEGAEASTLTNEQLLRRSVLSCLLWEDQFYESGVDIAARIASLVPKVDPETVASIAIDARSKMKLRHVPLLVTREMARYAGHKSYVSNVLPHIIKRPDEIAEFMALYWRQGKCPVSAQVKKGLARAFNQFDEYQLKKWQKSDAPIKMRDVMFMVHPKPINGRKGYTKDVRRTQEQLPNLTPQELAWRMMIDDTMVSADTWEHNLSEGADKRATFERLLKSGKLGALALLRNLRNMEQSGVDRGLIAQGIMDMKVDRVFPYRFITAAKHCDSALHPYLEDAMFKCVQGFPKFQGVTNLLVDVSGSMDEELVMKGKKPTVERLHWNTEANPNVTTRIDVASGLAILMKEMCGFVRIFTFSNQLVEIDPELRGFALARKIVQSQPHSGTYMGRATEKANKMGAYERLVILTDEQSHDKLPSALVAKSFVVNLAPYAYGIAYEDYIHVNGWSEHIFQWVKEYEREFLGDNDVLSQR